MGEEEKNKSLQFFDKTSVQVNLIQISNIISLISFYCTSHIFFHFKFKLLELSKYESIFYQILIDKETNSIFIDFVMFYCINCDLFCYCSVLKSHTVHRK